MARKGKKFVLDAHALLAGDEEVGAGIFGSHGAHGEGGGVAGVDDVAQGLAGSGIGDRLLSDGGGHHGVDAVGAAGAAPAASPAPGARAGSPGDFNGVHSALGSGPHFS